MASHASGRHRRPHAPQPFWPAFALGLALTFVVIQLSHWIEHTPPGVWLRRISYDFLQVGLRQELTPRQTQVVVVDIRDVPGPDAVPQKAPLTNRQTLRQILLALQAAGARAVAIDVNFAPPTAAESADDPTLGPPVLSAVEREFIDFCVAQTRAGFPIYLGVQHRLDGPREGWLGSLEAARLAVHGQVPAHSDFGRAPSDEAHSAAPEGRAEVRTMPLEMIIKPDGSPLPSLALALVTTPGPDGLPRPLAEPAAPWNSLLERSTGQRREPIEGVPGAFVETRFFPVNYGALESLQAHAVRAVGRRDIEAQAAVFKDAFVIIGRGLSEGDEHAVPDARRPLVAGVFIHASAAWTLLHAPLYTPTAFGRYAIDLGLSLIGLLAALRCGPWLERRGVSHALWHRLVPWLIGGAAFAIGVVFVRFTRLLWDDFAFVLLGLLLLEPWLHRILTGLTALGKTLAARFRPPTRKTKTHR